MKKILLLVTSLIILSGCCSFSSSGCPAPDQVICGDGYHHRTEGCDDGNTLDGDGCDATCDVEQGYKCFDNPSSCEMSCGDGILDAGEQCDDGNTLDGDGCSNACQSGYGTPEEICENESTVTRADNCWKDLALNQPSQNFCLTGTATHTSYCENISTDAGRNLCYRDIDECCLISGDLNMKNRCWNDLARNNEDVALCDNILDTRMRDQCQLDLASPGTITVPNIGGQWQYNLTVVSANGDCAGEAGATDTGSMSISQSGNEITVSGFAAGSLTGSLNGRTQAEVSGSYAEDGGQTTQTSTLTFADEIRPTRISITENWSWTGHGESCPNGVSTATATRVN